MKVSDVTDRIAFDDLDVLVREVVEDAIEDEDADAFARMQERGTADEFANKVLAAVNRRLGRATTKP